MHGVLKVFSRRYTTTRRIKRAALVCTSRALLLWFVLFTRSTFTHELMLANAGNLLVDSLVIARLEIHGIVRVCVVIPQRVCRWVADLLWIRVGIYVFQPYPDFGIAMCCHSGRCHCVVVRL